MTSTLTHTLFRTPSLEQGMHTASAGGVGLSDNELVNFQGSMSDPRMPLPLPPTPLFMKDLSRSSSSMSTPSLNFLTPQPSSQPFFHTRTPSLSADRASDYIRQQHERSTLPALNALASIASTKEPHTRSFSSMVPSPSSLPNMSPIPTPSISGNNNMPPVCQNCQTSTTPLWRRDESGSVLCNACGLFLKLHGRARPISLKTDVIKSRNRVKTANQGPKKPLNQPSLPASQSTDLLNGAHRRVSQMAMGMHSDRSGSPLSRTHTPGLPHDPNIAPQHMFDGVGLGDHAFATPALPNLGSDLSTFQDRGLDPSTSLSYEQLLAQNTTLRTRVSELEVIQMMYSDNENNLRRERDEAIRTQEDLKRRVEQLENIANAAVEAERPQKRARTEDDQITQEEEQVRAQEGQQQQQPQQQQQQSGSDPLSEQ